MTRPRPRIGSELLPVFLILACLAGTWFLVISMHRRAQAQRKVARDVVQTAPAPVEPPPAPPPPPPAPEPEPEPIPAPPQEDPTRKELARLGAEEAEQLLAAREADRKAEALENARKAAVTESERYRRREVVARAQIDELDARARTLEDEAEALATERDVLAMERDASKAALAKAKNRASSFAVLPHKGPNGTWRRPIILECHNGTVTLQPNGITFTMLDLSTLLSPRSSPVINVILREMIRTRGMATPDGAPAVPYIFFVVRPDGIRPYYEARARLEPLGIAFGYELVEQDAEIEYPDLEDLAEWDGSPPPLSSSPALADVREAPRPALRPGRAGTGRGESADSFVWPTQPSNALGGTDVANLDKPPGYPEGGGGGGGIGDRPGAGGSGLGDGRGGGDSWSGGHARGGVGPGPGRGRGGNAPDPFDSPAPFGGRPGGSTGSPGSNSPGNPGGNAVTGAGRYGLEPLSADRLPGLEEATPLGRLDGAGAPDHSGPSLEGPSGSGMPPPGDPDSDGHGHPLDTGGSSGTGSGGSGRQRVSGTQGSRGGGGAGGSQANDPGVPVGIGSMPQGSGAQGTSSGQPTQGLATGSSSSSGSGSRGPSSGSPSSGLPPLGSPLKIDAPLEIVVACGPDGVVLHPGGYRISKEVLKGKEPMLTKNLATIVRLRQQVDPLIRPIPSLRFLVEPGGNDTYRDARRQTVLSGLDWPISLQVGDSQILDYLPERL